MNTVQNHTVFEIHTQQTLCILQTRPAYLVQQPGDVAGQYRNLGSILGRDKRCFSSSNIQTTSQAIIHWAPRDLSPGVKQLGHAADNTPIRLCDMHKHN